ncbi:MAG: hypothetical protein WKG00_07580 [Polyangiaceae bacterium]
MSTVQALPSSSVGAPEPGVQSDAMQVSPRVHALPSLHAAPSALETGVQVPLDGLQVPCSKQLDGGEQMTGSLPVQVPDQQVSVWVQALPSSQAVLFGLFPSAGQTIAPPHVSAKSH